jgi:hypothetical protein
MLMNTVGGGITNNHNDQVDVLLGSNIYLVPLESYSTCMQCGNRTTHKATALNEVRIVCTKTVPSIPNHYL